MTVCVYVCVFVCVYLCVCACLYMYVCLNVHACMCPCVCMFMHVFVCLVLCVSVCSCIYMNFCVCFCMCVCVFTLWVLSNRKWRIWNLSIHIFPCLEYWKSKPWISWHPHCPFLLHHEMLSTQSQPEEFRISKAWHSKWVARQWHPSECSSSDGIHRTSFFSAISQVVPGKSSPFCPHDSTLAIPGKGQDLHRTVDISFSFVRFGVEQWPQMAGSALLWLPSINTPLGTG